MEKENSAPQSHRHRRSTSFRSEAKKGTESRPKLRTITESSRNRTATTHSTTSKQYSYVASLQQKQPSAVPVLQSKPRIAPSAARPSQRFDSVASSKKRQSEEVAPVDEPSESPRKRQRNVAKQEERRGIRRREEREPRPNRPKRDSSVRSSSSGFRSISHDQVVSRPRTATHQPRQQRTSLSSLSDMLSDSDSSAHYRPRISSYSSVLDEPSRAERRVIRKANAHKSQRTPFWTKL